MWLNSLPVPDLCYVNTNLTKMLLFFSLSLFHVPPPLMSVVPGSSLLSCLSQLTKKVRSNSTLQPSHHQQHIHSVQFYS